MYRHINIIISAAIMFFLPYSAAAQDMESVLESIERNNVQLPNYHRLDLGLNIYHRTKRGRLGIWNISIYNAYCRMNVFTIRVESSRDKQEANAKSMSFLPIIPMASYTWKF